MIRSRKLVDTRRVRREATVLTLSMIPAIFLMAGVIAAAGAPSNAVAGALYGGGFIFAWWCFEDLVEGSLVYNGYVAPRWEPEVLGDA